jgi:hypothetical protein
MLKVVLTIDTEVWPGTDQWPDRPLPRPFTGGEEAYERSVLGRTPSGDYGLRYLLQGLRSHNLHGVFFVEPLYSVVLGDASLRRTVREIVDEGHEVQLHVHTEWLSDFEMPGLPPKHRQNLGDYNLEQQTTVVRNGLALLRNAGAPSISALRAGNMGGNRDTPFAARAAGLSLDMSFDPSRGPDIRALLRDMSDRCLSESACPTIPLSYVRDYPGHCRPANLTALSFRELRHALRIAVLEQWPCFVILLHSFELVQRAGHRFGPLRPHQVNIARWNELCSFLARHRGEFATIGCDELLADANKFTRLPKVIRTKPLDTASRMTEQLISRFI